MSTSSSGDGGRAISGLRAGRAGEREVALTASGPEARVRSRRAGSGAGRWSRCRGGRERSRHPRRRILRSARAAPPAPGSSRAVTGTHSVRSNPAARAYAMPSAAAADCPPRAGRRVRPPRGRCRRRDALLVAHDDRELDRVLRESACSTSVTIAAASATRIRSATVSRSRCLARVKRFTGSTAAVLIAESVSRAKALPDPQPLGCRSRACSAPRPRAPRRGELVAVVVEFVTGELVGGRARARNQHLPFAARCGKPDEVAPLTFIAVGVK